MKSSQQLRDEIRNLTARVEAVVELATIENREINTDEQAIVDEVSAQKPKVEAQLENALKIEAIVASKMQVKPGSPATKPTADARLAVPLRVKSAFRKGVFASAEDAYKSGQWIRAALYGNSKAKQWCNDNGVRVKNAMGTGDNTKGGFLVPDSLQSSIIELREQYGVFARYAGQWNMAGAVDNAPRVNGEITSYYVGEGSEITASDMSFSNVRLEARKLASLTAVNSELNEDSVISLAQILARSVASKFAYDEDNAGFNGDGTSTYGGIVGAGASLLAGSTVTATGITTNATLTMAVFENAVGKLKEYPGIMPMWFVHKNTWANVMQRLLNALGGNSNSDVANGAPMMFLGYPVVISQVLYSGTGATGQIFGYFGDLGMTSYIGRRRGMQMATDSSVYFTRDQIAIRATQRYDINVYDVGTASNSGGLIELKFG
jgi:HK97 family phage major capsid protein